MGACVGDGACLLVSDGESLYACMNIYVCRPQFVSMYACMYVLRKVGGADDKTGERMCGCSGEMQ